MSEPLNPPHLDGQPGSQRRSDDAFHQIVEMIFAGRFAPGARLPSEREMTGIVGVSRTTLRDALNRLEARGFVERRSKSGTYVATALPEALREPMEAGVDAELVEFRHLIEVRKPLEIWAVARAVARPDERALQEMRACLADMRQSMALDTEAQFERFSQADLAFHQVIAGMTENPLYVHLFHFLFSLVLRSISLSRRIVMERYGETNLARHEAIYEAIRAGDVEAAQEAMRAHFAFVERELSSDV